MKAIPFEGYGPVPFHGLGNGAAVAHEQPGQNLIVFLADDLRTDAAAQLNEVLTAVSDDEPFIRGDGEIVHRIKQENCCPSPA